MDFISLSVCGEFAADHLTLGLKSYGPLTCSFGVGHLVYERFAVLSRNTRSLSVLVSYVCHSYPVCIIIFD